MRIGIDCRNILNQKGEVAGVGHYTYFLVKNILKTDKKNEYFLYFDYKMANKTKEFEQKNVQIKFFPFSQYKRYMPFSYSHMLISAVLIKDKLDVFHAPAYACPLTYPGKIVLTVHDLAIYRHPSWFPSGQSFSTKILVPKSIKKAVRIIAVSKATKRDIMKLFKTPSDKVSVVYEGVVPQKSIGKTKSVSKTIIQRKYKIGEKYLFFIGTIEPRKNLVALIKAYNSLLLKNYKKFKDYDLVIAGKKGWKYEEIFKTIKDQKFNYKIRFLNYVSQEHKVALMKNATCFVFPTLYEGFGLPIAEAMSMGVPVITSKVSSMPEVSGDAALLIDPNKIVDIEKALAKVLANKRLREKMSKAGISQAKKFTWAKAAKETIKVYQDIGKKKEKKVKEKKK
ncbi:glycosyltransferase family 4 protein [Patescibacteria group bacterium]|nr:glycosyltransferase family 4 protein [Patescibacteria group bacterium]MBU1075426.1 glycosyltransferase family 4 protein [Patescibacteria group bacterium]MBU1952484.1 glycosyltransferase family 4 protein [Patescibacteria group bacterium]